MTVLDKILENFVGHGLGEQSQSDEPTITEERRKEIAREHLEEFGKHGGHALHYCELCNQVFGTGDMFYDHRRASDYDVATEWDGDGGFRYKKKIQAGEELPDGAVVGALVPCTPMIPPDSQS